MPTAGRTFRRTVLVTTGCMVVALLLPGSAGATPTTNLTAETFTHPTLSNPSDWVAGYLPAAGANVAPCLTAAPVNGGSPPIAGCLSGSGSAVDADGSGVLSMTDAHMNEGTFALYNHALPTSGGLDISFSEAQYGGSGGADGMSFFLVDGSTNLTQAGSAGGGLGYSSYRTNSIDGVQNGLLGIGMDAYGNFSYTGGDDPACSTPVQARIANSIAIRGPGNGQSGYCFLANSTQQGHTGFTLHGTSRGTATHVIRIVIDPATGISPMATVYVDGVVAVTAPEPAELMAANIFKFGFGGATGGQTDQHEIWGATINSVTVVPPSLGLTGTTVGGAPTAPTTANLQFTGAVRTVGGSEPDNLAFHLSLPTAVTATGTPTGTGWTCTPVTTWVPSVSCTYAVTTPLPPGTALPVITVPINISGAVADHASLGNATLDDGAVTANASAAPAGTLTVSNPPAPAQPTPTATYLASWSGIDAYPISRFGARQLEHGQAATLSGDGLFAFDSAKLTKAGRAQAASAARHLRDVDAVRCEGFTDYAGDRDHEFALAAARAKAVCAALKTYGATVIIATRKFGPEHPAVVGGTARGRKENRRVVMVVTGS